MKRDQGDGQPPQGRCPGSFGTSRGRPQTTPNIRSLLRGQATGTETFLTQNVQISEACGGLHVYTHTETAAYDLMQTPIRAVFRRSPLLATATTPTRPHGCRVPRRLLSFCALRGGGHAAGSARAREDVRGARAPPPPPSWAGVAGNGV